MKSPSWMYSATADNSGHTATLRSAKIQHSRTSHVRKTLGETAVNIFKGEHHYDS